MVHRLVGWAESQDTGAVLTAVDAMTDDSTTTQDDDVVVPKLTSKIGAVFAMGTTISQAQLTAPSFGDAFDLDVAPVNIGAEPDSNPAWMPFFENPIQLDAGEGLRALVAEGGATELGHVFAWLLDQIDPIPAGEIFTVRTTGTTTLVANTWTTVPLTFSQQIPAGTWAVVGMRAESAGASAARLIFNNQQERPGVIAFDAADDFAPEVFRNGRLGVWGTFDNRFPPQADFASISADTAETVWLDLMKVA